MTEDTKNSIRKVCGHPVVSGIITAIMIAFILWLAESLSAMPANYAKKAELKAVDDKFVAELKTMDEKKLNVVDYRHNHELLRSEIKEDLNELKKATDTNREYLLKIYQTQQRSERNK